MSTFEKAINQSGSTNVSAHFYYAVLCDKQKDTNKAISLLKKCLLIDQEHFPSCIHLATFLANQGENQKASKYFKHALKLDPNSVPANFGLGKILHALTESVEASIPYYEKVINKDPNHYKAYC